MKMSKPPFGVDERNVSLIQKLCTRFYLVTMAVLGCILVYRQAILGQSIDALQDIAMLFTANVILWIGAALYYGGVSVGRVKPLPVIAIYVVLVVLGTVFTAVKYGSATFGAILDHFITVASVSAGLVGLWVFFAYMGQRKMEKELSE